MGKDYRIPAFGPYVTLAKHKYSTQRRPLVIVGRNDGLQRFSLSVKANDQALFLSDDGHNHNVHNNLDHILGLF